MDPRKCVVGPTASKYGRAPPLQATDPEGRELINPKIQNTNLENTQDRPSTSEGVLKFCPLAIRDEEGVDPKVAVDESLTSRGQTS